MVHYIILHQKRIFVKRFTKIRPIFCEISETGVLQAPRNTRHRVNKITDKKEMPVWKKQAFFGVMLVDF